MKRLILLPLLLSAIAADWPQLLGPDRNATSQEKTIRTDWDRQPLTVAWQRDVGLGFASPVVAGGKLILFHRVGDREIVDCLDAPTGKSLWTHATETTYDDPLGRGNGPKSTPTIAGNRVYTVAPGGGLTCLDLATGKPVWQRDLARDYMLRQSFFGVGSSPIVEGDLLLVNVGDKNAGIVAFHRETGKEVWRATNQEASYSSPVVGTFDGQRRAIFFTRDGLVGLDPTTGKVAFEQRWRSRMPASVNATMPVLVGDHIFLTASYDTGAIIWKVEKDRLKELWNNDESLSSQYSTPVAVGEFLYGFDGREDVGVARLRCIEWATGKVRWTAEGTGVGSIVRVGDVLLTLTQKGQLEALATNPTKREVLATQKMLAGPVRAHLAVADGMLFARDEKKLVALSAK